MIDNGKVKIDPQGGRAFRLILGLILGSRFWERKGALTDPVLVSVRLPGDGQEGTVLRLDSGSSAPVLFASRGEILPWLQRAHPSRGSVSGKGNGISFATIPAQSVRLADHLERQISFLTPISDGTRYAEPGEDGLLPTALFKEVLVSVRDGFVVFDPRDACPHPIHPRLR